MTRYFFVILLMALIGVAIVVKAGITMFAERQYWQDVADRFVKENVTVKPNRGNIISSDGKLMASSLPEYRIYMDFMSGEKDEKRRQKDQARRDSILNANMDSICIGLHKIFPDKSAAQFKAHLKKGRQAKSRNYLIYPKRISYIQYKEAFLFGQIHLRTVHLVHTHSITDEIKHVLRLLGIGHAAGQQYKEQHIH